MCILVVIVLKCIEPDLASCDTIEVKWIVSITIMGVAYIPTKAFTGLLFWANLKSMKHTCRESIALNLG